MLNIPGIITLDERYYIDVDPYNWILKQVKVTADTTSTGRPNKRAGQRCDVVIGYFPSLEQALNAYAEQILKESVSGSVAELNIDGVKSILEDIKIAITKLSLTLNAKQEGVQNDN